MLTNLSDEIFSYLVNLANRFNASGPFSYDYLLGESRNFTSPAEILFIDHDIQERYIRQMISSGKTVICYVNVVTYEKNIFSFANTELKLAA